MILGHLKKEKDRMCDFFENNVELCPLKIYHSGWNCLECDECCLVRIDFAIKTVQEWSNEHQIKNKAKRIFKGVSEYSICSVFRCKSIKFMP